MLRSIFIVRLLQNISQIIRNLLTSPQNHSSTLAKEAFAATDSHDSARDKSVLELIGNFRVITRGFLGKEALGKIVQRRVFRSLAIIRPEHTATPPSGGGFLDCVDRIDGVDSGQNGHC